VDEPAVCRLLVSEVAIGTHQGHLKAASPTPAQLGKGPL